MTYQYVPRNSTQSKEISRLWICARKCTLPASSSSMSGRNMCGCFPPSSPFCGDAYMTGMPVKYAPPIRNQVASLDNWLRMGVFQSIPLAIKRRCRPSFCRGNRGGGGCGGAGSHFFPFHLQLEQTACSRAPEDLQNNPAQDLQRLRSHHGIRRVA
ncbi:hypothetical protein BC832DRAFT_554414 [Gaertneriomyces semiglobifer]|nr:hypothetical protein BC832DRAFT_554414 [Gaertneriomyces semiglobifer]